MAGFRSEEEMNELVFANDQESFMQLFEKPTQIYRFLMYRSKISPIFLQRTLSYMVKPKRFKKRSFRVDDLLGLVESKMIEKGAERSKWDFLNLTFQEYQNKEVLNAHYVELEVNLLIINHKKRKESTSPVTTVNIGKVRVKCNTSDSDGQHSTISIPRSCFTFSTDSAKSTILQLKAFHHINECDASPPKKKLKKNTSNLEKDGQYVSKKPLHSCNIQRNPERKKTLVAELVIFSRKNQCCLTEGTYELELHEDASSSRFSENMLWQAVSDERCNDDDIKNPKVVFNLDWAKQPNDENSSTMQVDYSSINFHNGMCFNAANLRSTRGFPLNRELQVKSELNLNNIKKQKIYYQFLSSNNSRQQTVAKESRCCPWCLVDCKVLPSLMFHLKYCHGRFNFVYVENQNGGRIDVTMNGMYDGSYVGNPHDLHRNVGQAFTRSGPMRRMNVTEILVCKNKANNVVRYSEAESEDSKLRPVIHGHTRVYYHTMTCQPIDPKNIEVDSESENDPLWLQLKTQQMIDEFMDVNEGEKEVMKLWNLHVMRNNYVGDCQMFDACREFVRLHSVFIVNRNLSKNLILHFANLFDFGLITSRELCSVATQFLKVSRNTC